MSNERPPYKHTAEWREAEASLRASRERRELAESELARARAVQADAVRRAVSQGFYRWDIGQAAGLSGVTVWKLVKSGEPEPEPEP